ncbi:MAG: hypothetical protein IPL06_22155 [Betaproteobacteria bacterium]|nr:hypothetical protein [Betaproteobacteria bacterium]
MRTALAAFFLAAVLPAAAAGSFDADVELMPIRRQVPDLWAALGQSFDLAKSGWANRIGTPVNAELGGRRIGPYCLAAKPKGAPGPNSWEICFNTEAKYSDARGLPALLENAKSVEETFASVEIKPMGGRLPAPLSR